jgi:exopolysaccharide production protein ExoQ
MTEIATALFALGMIATFVLDRDPKARTSSALWLPIAWLLIAGSRPVSVWLQIGPESSPEQYLEGSPIDRAIYVALLAAGIIVLLGRRRSVARLLKANGPILIFIAYCAVSISYSDYPGVALKHWIKSLGDYVMILIVLTDRDQLNAVKQVLAKPAFLLLPLSVLLIKYYPDLGRTYSAHWDATQFSIGVAEDKNMLGMTCLVFGLAALWRLLNELSGPRHTRIIAVHGTLVAMAIWLLAKSHSMTSLSCFVLTGAVLAATTFLRRARKNAFVHLTVAATLLVCLSPLFLDSASGILQSMGRDPTLTGRTEIWKNLLDVPMNPLLGTGFESFWLGERLERLWAIPGMHINEAHNGYLEVYLNLGWIGVALMTGIMVAGYRNVIRLLQQDPEAGRLRLAYFVSGAAYNLTEAATRTMSLMWIAFLFSMIALPALSVKKVRDSREPAAQTRLLDTEEVA